VATIDLTPQVLDIKAYGGDTVPILITFPPGYVAGRIWKAQVRTAATNTTTDAEFQVTLGATQDDPVTLILTSESTRALVTSAVLRAEQEAAAKAPARASRGPFSSADPKVVGAPLASYKGVWDCQLAPSGGGDPTTTIVRGTVELTLDVSRTP